MIDAEHYSSWIEQDNIRLFLAEIDGVPVSTAATIQTGSTASLEFVSALKEHRRQKAAITLCSRAIEALFDRGVETVTLSGSSEAVSLYERLGFHWWKNVMRNRLTRRAGSICSLRWTMRKRQKRFCRKSYVFLVILAIGLILIGTQHVNILFFQNLFIYFGLQLLFHALRSRTFRSNDKMHI